VRSTAQEVPGLADVLAPEGWPNASSAPVGEGDPGRYHCLFGRDSLITSLAVLPARPDVAAATLRALARLQGTREDVTWDEEPGKIVHEVRSAVSVARQGYLGLTVPDGELRYYGSADSTPLFLHLLAATGDESLAAELEPNWRAAGEWLLDALERGNGLVRWHRRAPGGLVQQGWRDTVDPAGADRGHVAGRGGSRLRCPSPSQGSGILHADGSVPEAPVADADTQAAALAGLRALARLSGAAAHEKAVGALAARIGQAFDAETMAVDAHDRPVRGAGSQLGWLLWAGAPVQDAVERLCEPDVLTDYGLRTLSDRHPCFDAFSYHRGSVWPFDSWLGWAGLRAAGRAAQAERVRAGVLAGIERIGRYPELYAVADGRPQPIAMSNHVQAWTVAAAWALRNEWDGAAHVVA
jgi:glycogen debranching enzyme